MPEDLPTHEKKFKAIRKWKIKHFDLIFLKDEKIILN